MNTKLRETRSNIVSQYSQEIADLLLENNLHRGSLNRLYEFVDDFVSGRDNKVRWLIEWSKENDQTRARAAHNLLHKARHEFRLTERRDDYNVTYAKNGDLNNVTDPDTDHIKRPKEMPAKIHGKPDFKYDGKSNWGPIPRTGVGRNDYNAKYSKSGDILEESFEAIYALNEDEIPTHAKNGKLIEKAKRKSPISPALRESIEKFDSLRYLKENKLIDAEGLQLIESMFDDDDDDWMNPDQRAAYHSERSAHGYDDDDEDFDEFGMMSESDPIADMDDHQAAVWQEAGLDDDSLDDMGRMSDDPDYEDNSGIVGEDEEEDWDSFNDNMSSLDDIDDGDDDDWHEYDGSQVSAEEEFGDADWDGEPWIDEEYDDIDD